MATEARRPTQATPSGANATPSKLDGAADFTRRIGSKNGDTRGAVDFTRGAVDFTRGAVEFP